MKTGREMPEHLASVDRGNPIEAMAQSKSDAYRASDFFLACAKGITYKCINGVRLKLNHYCLIRSYVFNE